MIYIPNTIAANSSLTPEQKLAVLKETKGGAWYDDWRPYCIQEQVKCSMPRMTKQEYGFKCPDCGNMIGWNGERLEESPLNRISLLEFAEITVRIMERINGGPEFSSYYLLRKSQCFHRYQNGLITSTAHGTEFFHNVIKYWNNPDEYCAKPSKNDTVSYEYNFVLILKQNHNK